MKNVFLLLAMCVVLTFSSSVGVPASSQVLSFFVDSKNGAVADIQDSLQCIQHFLEEISKGSYTMDSNQLAAESDKASDILLKLGENMNDCGMLWSQTGAQRDSSHRTLKKRSTGLLGTLLQGLGLEAGLCVDLSTSGGKGCENNDGEDGADQEGDAETEDGDDNESGDTTTEESTTTEM